MHPGFSRCFTSACRVYQGVYAPLTAVAIVFAVSMHTHDTNATPQIATSEMPPPPADAGDRDGDELRSSAAAGISCGLAAGRACWLGFLFLWSRFARRLPIMGCAVVVLKGTQCAKLSGLQTHSHLHNSNCPTPQPRQSIDSHSRAAFAGETWGLTDTRQSKF